MIAPVKHEVPFGSALKVKSNTLGTKFLIVKLSFFKNSSFGFSFIVTTFAWLSIDPWN